MDRLLVIFGTAACEYFCYRCRQLRLSPGGVPYQCQHCGNKDLKIGPIGLLDKQALIKKMDGLTG